MDDVLLKSLWPSNIRKNVRSPLHHAVYWHDSSMPSANSSTQSKYQDQPKCFLDPPSQHNCLYPSLTAHNLSQSLEFPLLKQKLQVPCKQGRIFFGMLQMATQSLQKQFGNILNNKLQCIYTIVYQFYDTEQLCTHTGVFEVKILTNVCMYI